NEINKFKSLKNSLIQKGDYYLPNDSTFFLNKSFDDQKSDKIFQGSGAFHGVMKEYNTLLSETLLPLKKDKDYEISFWYYNKGNLINSNMFVVQEASPDKKRSEWIGIFNTAECSNIAGDWTL